jgi:hypothetical protein
MASNTKKLDHISSHLIKHLESATTATATSTSAATAAAHHSSAMKFRRNNLLGSVEDFHYLSCHASILFGDEERHGHA